MPNIMGVLRAEIRRLARKETKQEMARLKKQVTVIKRRIAESRQRLQNLEQVSKRVAPMAAIAAARGAAARGGDDETQVRFSPVWVRSHRKKLAMSRLLYAKLVGVSPQTIMGWEAGRTRPRRQALQTWRALRARGVRELKAMVMGEGTGEAQAIFGGRAGRPARARRKVAKRVRRRVRRAVRKVARRRAVRKVVRRRAVVRLKVKRVVRRAGVRRKVRAAVGRRVRAKGGAKKK